MDHQGSPGFSYFIVSFSIFPTGLLALRVYESTLTYKMFTGLNILVLSFIIVSGFIKGDLTYWKLMEQSYQSAAAGSGDAYRLGGYPCCSNACVCGVQSWEHGGD